MPSDLSTILRLLPTLSPADTQQVRAKASALLSLNGGSSSGNSGPGRLGKDFVRHGVVDCDFILRGIVFELRRRGLLGSKVTIYQRFIPASYQQDAVAVRQHLSEHIKQLSSTDEEALGRLLARSLADYLERGKVPISPRTILANVNKMLVALDAAFPGYLVTGWLPFCWRARGYGS